MSSMATTGHAAFSTALTPSGAWAEWQPRPCTSQRMATLPLWAVTGRPPVGSPMITPAGNGLRCAISASMGRTPIQPTSPS